MTLAERIEFINDLTDNMRKELVKEAGKYPDTWDGIELRWRIADTFSQVICGEIGKRKGKRYLDYKNHVLVNGLY